ncbi:thioredoxin reductase [Ophiocordyceps sinensis CO18]|uniref:Thioredoxin reductase n=1 Tax=Ophiocordyceps sinensis (strain Co18 / CGMCC 3.14243) TaxID=911162 RepID=T5AEQ8_OPHSC|nr:thioredoxin reductase [Ophiocordyceps sinensis CO18]
MANGTAAGGQLTTTTEVENFPGFPKGIMGQELMDNMRQQSERFGTEIITDTVAMLDLSSRPFRYSTEFSPDETHTADAIIVATGASARRLDLPGEAKYWQNGISACAVCDGALPIFRNKPLFVIGGGGPGPRGQQEGDEIRGGPDGLMTHVVVRDAATADKLDVVEANGLFYAVGHDPATALVKGQVAMDDEGYIKTTPGTTMTSVDGVFAAGDVQDKRYRQAITSAGTGCMAALEAERYLAEQEES